MIAHWDRMYFPIVVSALGFFCMETLFWVVVSALGFFCMIGGNGGAGGAGKGRKSGGGRGQRATSSSSGSSSAQVPGGPSGTGRGGVLGVGDVVKAPQPLRGAAVELEGSAALAALRATPVLSSAGPTLSLGAGRGREQASSPEGGAAGVSTAGAPYPLGG